MARLVEMSVDSAFRECETSDDEGVPMPTVLRKIPTAILEDLNLKGRNEQPFDRVKNFISSCVKSR